MITTLLILFVSLIRKKRNLLSDRDWIATLGLCGIPVCFFAGYLFLYKEPAMWTITRGIAVGSFAFTFGLCALSKKSSAAIATVWLIICLVFFSTGHIGSVFINDSRFVSEEWKQGITETREMMSEMEKRLPQSREKTDPWNYTVLTYETNPAPIALALQPGYSINSMLDGTVCEKARWVVFGIRDENIEMMNEYEKRGYKRIGESTDCCLYIKEEKD